MKAQLIIDGKTQKFKIESGFDIKQEESINNPGEYKSILHLNGAEVYTTTLSETIYHASKHDNTVVIGLEDTWGDQGLVLKHLGAPVDKYSKVADAVYGSLSSKRFAKVCFSDGDIIAQTPSGSIVSAVKKIDPQIKKTLDEKIHETQDSSLFAPDDIKNITREQTITTERQKIEDKLLAEEKREETEKEKYQKYRDRFNSWSPERQAAERARKARNAKSLRDNMTPEQRKKWLEMKHIIAQNMTPEQLARKRVMQNAKARENRANMTPEERRAYYQKYMEYRRNRRNQGR